MCQRKKKHQNKRPFFRFQTQFFQEFTAKMLLLSYADTRSLFFLDLFLFFLFVRIAGALCVNVCLSNFEIGENSHKPLTWNIKLNITHDRLCRETKQMYKTHAYKHKCIEIHSARDVWWYFCINIKITVYDRFSLFL